MRNFWGVIGLAAAALTTPGLAQAAGASLHGFADVSVKNDYITPRGLRVTSDGMAVQFLNGLVIDVPQDPAGTITDTSYVVGAWTDFNPGVSALHTHTLNEFDWFVGANAKIGKSWNAGVQFVQFISGPGAFKTENNIEFSLAYDDALKPIKLNPYAKFFWAVSGDSTVVTGKRGGTFDVELGAVPTVDLGGFGLPATLSAPTWVTVGPESYWGKGGGNAGVVSTGLKLTVPIKTPPATGHWSVYAGYQYYHLINDNLVLAESIINNGKHSRNLHLIQAGIGLGF
jgi:hypothetical protein